MNFPQDNSSQLNYIFFPYGISNVDIYTTSNELINALNTKQNILTSSTVLLGNGSNITNINYNNITLNKPDLTVYNSWTKSGNDNYKTITGGNTLIGTTTNIGNYKLLVTGSGNFGSCLSTGFGSMSNMQPNISDANFLILKHNTFNGNVGANFPNPECFFIMGNNSSSGQIPWGFYSGVVKYLASVVPSNSLRYDIGSCLIQNTLATLTGTNTFSPLLSILFNGNVGIGSSFPSYKLDVNGTFNASNIFKNSINIDNIYISSNVFYNTISTKQDTLTISSPLLGVGSNISDINYNNITINKPDLSGYITSNTAANIYINSNSLTNIINSYGYDTITARITSINNQNIINSNYFINSNSLTNIINSYGYLSTTTASSIYLPITTASSTYLTQTNASSTYLPITTASSTYLPITTASSTYLTQTNASSTYLPITTASSTYLPITNGTTTGVLTAPNITTSTSLIYKGTELSTTFNNYLPLSGGTMTASLIMTGSSSAFYFGGGTGAALGEAGSAGAFSSSASTNDCILRSRTANQLILQSGGSAAAIIINSGNNVLITGTQLILNTTSGNNQLYINSSISSANNCIQIKNNSTNYGYIGIAGTTFGGNYQNNLFIETTNAFVVNTGTNTSTSVPRMIILANGNVGIGTTNPQYLLDVNGNANINGILTVLKNNWIKSSDNIDRIYFGDVGTTYFHSGNTGTGGFNFRNFAQSDIFTINENGNITSTGPITSSSGYSYFNGLRINGGDTGNTIYQPTGDLGITTNTTNINLGMNTYGTKVQISPTTTTIYTNTTISATTPSLNIKSSSESDSAILYLATPFSSGSALKCAIIAQGQSTFSRSKLHFCLDNTADNSTTYNASVANSRMSIDYNGSVLLTNSLYFKTDVWNYSSDNNQRLYFGNNGITYYQGYGQYVLDINHEWRNHQGVQKMRLDNSGNLILQGVLQCKFITIANTNRDLTGINIENTSVNDINNTVLYCIQGTFTGFHRVFTDDELFNIEQPQQFKDDYEGRIVISNGKIATDTTDNGVQNNTEWEILYDKAGITIEDALPKIELSRKKKDKRVFGVLGDRRRRNNRPERMIVNSVGEGSMYVINSNSNIENGDYIQSSDYLGFGERQDDDILHNYTVAKATMDCNFELDSQYYKCFEIDELDINGNKLRVAFIAVTYHCG